MEQQKKVHLRRQTGFQPQKYAKTPMETTSPITEQRLMDRHEFFRLVGASAGAALLMGCASACAGATNPDLMASPARKIDFSLDLNDKANESLKTKGGYVIINDVMVAQTKDGFYIAVSAKCTHEGTLLVYKPVENQFYCPLDLSRYDARGTVAVGPATQDLQRYLTVADTTTGVLRISN